MASTVWIDVIVKLDRPKAVLVNNGKVDAWLPKSQIVDEEDELGVGVETKVEIPIWLAEEKGLV